jgi:DNA-binding GntR family transcriptional regulator
MAEEPPRVASQSGRVYEALRSGILGGDFAPTETLRPGELAANFGVSLAVVREALLRLVGEGLADRLHNRGFAVPAAGADRWREIAEARAVIEPQALRLAIRRGDVTWESRVRSAHHTLARTPAYNDETGRVSDEWSRAHHDFHRTLLDGCGNSALLDTFERFWNASELTRRWSTMAAPDRDFAGEHAALEQACLDRDADRAAALLTAHVTNTAAALTTLDQAAPPSPDHLNTKGA